MLAPDMDMYSCPVPLAALASAGIAYTAGYNIGNLAFGSMAGAIGTGAVMASLAGGTAVIGQRMGQDIVREHRARAHFD